MEAIIIKNDNVWGASVAHPVEYHKPHARATRDPDSIQARVKCSVSFSSLSPCFLSVYMSLSYQSPSKKSLKKKLLPALLCEYEELLFIGQKYNGSTVTSLFSLYDWNTPVNFAQLICNSKATQYLILNFYWSNHFVFHFYYYQS